MKRFLTSGLFVFFSVALLNAFSKENILSPVEGTWNNPQPLIIDVPEGWDVYFSYSSSNPLESGLIYDFPVENEQSGKITLYVIAVDPEGNRTNVTVNFTVDPVKPYVRDIDTGSVFNDINKGAIINLPAGRRFSIPNGFKYCLGKNRKPELEAKDIFVSENNMLEKYVPCTISDGKSIWRFIIHSVSSIGEGDIEQTAPFIITDWNEVTFLNDDFIYQLDSGYWGPASRPFVIDRNSPHVIRWQSVAYEEGNEVYSIKLPPKPEIKLSKTKKGSLVFSIPENEKFQLKANNMVSVNCRIPEEIFKTIEIDVFDGDESAETINFSVYYEGLYQGELQSSFLLDRQCPDSPEFIVTSNKPLVHEKVRVSIQPQPDVEVYYAVSKPVTSIIGFEGATKETFDSIPEGSYKKYDGRTFVLSSSHTDATFYKLNAYAVDCNGKKSSVSEYRVIVDESNYYFSPQGRKTPFFMDKEINEPDGSVANPFTTFAQVLETINSNLFTRVHISGDFEIKEGEVSILSNVTFIGDKTHITVSPFSTINVYNSDFKAEGCIFEKNISSELAESYVTKEQNNAMRTIFNFSNSKVIMDDCDVNAVFGHEGVMFYSEKSKLNFRNCGFTSTAQDYACIIADDCSEINAENTDFTAVASTASCISEHGGTIVLRKCLCSVLGHLCHVAELNSAYAEFTENIFSVKNVGSPFKTEFIWKNADTVLTLIGNIENDEY